MLVTSLQTLALSALFLAGLSLLGYPTKILVERFGYDFPAPAALPGMALLFVVSWYWLDVGRHGLAVPTIACLIVASGYLLFDVWRRGLAVFEFDIHRVKLCAASFVVASLLILLNWSAVLSLPYVTTATTGNSDAISYVTSAQHLSQQGFGEPGPVPGYDLGQRATRDGFSSDVLIGSFGTVTTLGAWKVADSVLFATIALGIYTLAFAIDALLSRRRWLFSALVAGSANATLLVVYVQVSWFLGQVVAMAVTPLIVVAVVRQRSAVRRAELIAPIAVAVSVFLVLMSHYAHMAIAGPAIVAAPALAAAFAERRSPRATVHSVLRSGAFLAGSLVLACALVPAWLVNAVRQTREYKGVDAGWALPGFLPADLLGFTRTVVPEPSPARLIWSIVALGLFVVCAWWIRRREPSMSRFGTATATVILGSYLVVYLRVGPNYQQWKWITFFQPMLVALIVAIAALALEQWLRRIHSSRVAPIAVLAFLVAVSMNTGDGSGTALRDKRQFVYASVDHWQLSQSTALRSLSEVNIDLPFGDTMWAVYFLRDKTVYLEQPTYYPQSAPQARWSVVPAIGALTGDSVVPINDRFRLIAHRDDEGISDTRTGLASSLNVRVAQDADGIVRGHATVTNAGPASWLPSEAAVGGVTLGVRLEDENGTLAGRDWVRIPIVAGRTFAIPPGTVVDLGFELPSLARGNYHLVFDLVSEGVGRFENPVQVPLTISQTRGG